MATKPRKTAPKTGFVATLNATRLKKLAVEVIIPREESGKGKLHLTYNAALLLPTNEEHVVGISLQIKGEGLSGNAESSGKVAFTIDAVIEGMFALPSKPKEEELVGRDVYMADYLIPILSDMIETLLSKCDYRGITLPRSFPNKPATSVPQPV